MNMMLQHLDSTKFYRVKADLETDFDAKGFNQKRDQKRIKEETINATKTNLPLIGIIFQRNIFLKLNIREGTTYTADVTNLYIFKF
jgi:hypothetical protein